MGARSMASRYERKRIADELRLTAADSLGSETLQKALARVTSAKDTSWRGVLRRLAELIEPPGPSNEERHDVATDIRTTMVGRWIRYKEQFFDELAEVAVGYEDHHEFDVVAERLADLIDPGGEDDD